MGASGSSLHGGTRVNQANRSTSDSVLNRGRRKREKRVQRTRTQGHLGNPAIAAERQRLKPSRLKFGRGILRRGVSRKSSSRALPRPNSLLGGSADRSKRLAGMEQGSEVFCATAATHDTCGGSNSFYRTSSKSAPRSSFRMRRQPSTYGELHDLVEQRKLGVGATKGLVGLENLGNTCFMNSALQCLVNCEALTDYFLGFDWRAEINRGNLLGHKGKMAEAFGALANDMWSTPRSYISPVDFKRQAGEAMPLFAGYEQQDVQEFLAFMLDAVHEDLNRVPNADRKYVEAKEAKEGEAEELVAMEAWKGYLTRNRSIVVDLFQGQLRSALQCGACKHQSIKFDPFMYLSVPLPGELDAHRGNEAYKTMQSDFTLEACIKRFCEAEVLEGDDAWYCPKCKKHQPASKKLDLWKVPPVLIVHLKRFADTGKIEDPVSFPLEGLDLSEVVKSPQKDAPDYDLYAVANHKAYSFGGHYTACAKNRASKDWYLFNDENVKPVKPADVQSPEAYVLFYTKMCNVEVPLTEEELAAEDSGEGPEHSQGNDLEGIREAGYGEEGDRDGTEMPTLKRKQVPRRAAAVVRRQSVSKPHNWPHVDQSQSDGGNQGMKLPSLLPAYKQVEPTPPITCESTSTPASASRRTPLLRMDAEQGYGPRFASSGKTPTPLLHSPLKGDASGKKEESSYARAGMPSSAVPDLLTGDVAEGDVR